MKFPQKAKNRTIILPSNCAPGYISEKKWDISGHLMQRADSLEKTLRLGKFEGSRRGRQRMRCLDGIINSTDIKSEQIPGDSKGQGNLACCSPWGNKELDMTDKSKTIWNYMCTPIVTVTLFVITKIWKQPKCPSIDKWTKKIHTLTQRNITQLL